MSIKNDHWATAASSSQGDQIAGRVVVDIVEMVFVKQRLEVLCALLFMTGRRVDFSDCDPFAQDAFVIAIDVIFAAFTSERLASAFTSSVYCGTVLTWAPADWPATSRATVRE